MYRVSCLDSLITNKFDMKDLSNKEFEDAPAKVKYIYMCAFMKQPIGSSIYEDAIKEHPEYFPDEVEHRKKWEAIPKEVHDAYFEEYHKIDEELFSDIPHKGKGIMFFANNPEADKEFSRAWEAANKKALPLLEALHRKFYSKYGIEWNEM